MAFGEIEYSKNGNPVCEICGASFSKLMHHVVQKHGITARQYKQRFGLPLTKGVMSDESRLKCIENAMEHFYWVKDKLWATPRFFVIGHTFYQTAPHLRRNIIIRANEVRRIKKRQENFIQWLKAKELG